MPTVEDIRKDFPILNTRVHNRPLCCLDNAATLQMPLPVQEDILQFYRNDNSNVHRGVHTLSQRSTDRYEDARRTVATFIGAAPEEVIFTSGTTDSINRLARMLEPSVRPGQQILVSAMEHHSNLLPWQELCARTGTVLRIIPLDERGDLDLQAMQKQLQQPTFLVAVAWVSNVLGTVNPIREIAMLAHEAGAQVLVDGAQGMKLGKPDVRELGCDYLAFSGHKLGALTGIGVLCGRRSQLEQLPAVSFGGGMVDRAGYESSSYGPVPQRFEAGTPNYVGAISFAAALDYLNSVGISWIARQEQQLTDSLCTRLQALPELHVVGNPARRCSAVSLYADGIHAFDLGVMLDTLGIAVRTGHMCAQPLVESLGHSSLLRISPAFYNTEAELEQLISALGRILPLLKGART